jgi:dihydropyrimidinase
MAYKGAVMVDDETLYKVMQVAHTTGALVMVHAENGDVIDVLVKQALAEKKTDPIWHAWTRPPITEGEATNRAIQLAHMAGAPLYVVHVSCREAIEPIERAREADWAAWGETCTQYLFIDESALKKPRFEGAKYVYTPPPRTKEHQAALWKALHAGTLSVVSTDHCPFKWKGQKTLGKGDFSKIPNGGVGIENRMHMMFSGGVRKGRISLNRMVELCSTAPARFFGLYPRKGTVAIGSDADLVVWDPRKKHTISAKTHRSNSDYTLFEGTTVTGAPKAVLVRGQVIVQDDKLVAKPGAGRFVRRSTFGGA